MESVFSFVFSEDLSTNLVLPTPLASLDVNSDLVLDLPLCDNQRHTPLLERLFVFGDPNVP